MLTGGVGIGHMGEREACPLTDIEVVEEQGDKGCRQVQSYFEIGPRRDGRGSCQWDSLASG